MKTRTLKIITTILMAMVILCTVSQVAFASDLIEGITPNKDAIDAGPLQEMAGKILGLIQIASAVAAVILIAIFGFKFIMGSANEKADYQKSFIPLIVGVVVVFASTSIAKLLFSTFAG